MDSKKTTKKQAAKKNVKHQKADCDPARRRLLEKTKAAAPIAKTNSQESQRRRGQEFSLLDSVASHRRETISSIS